ncbi:MAG TPA: hypothetical protein VEP90_24500 [Methylomirabilota bacterium]|nr:hypothetical protein [Methylomirabilota bacterium]
MLEYETVRYMLFSAGLTELSEDDIQFIEASPHPEAIIPLLVQYKQEAMSKKTYTLEDVAKSFERAMQIAKGLKHEE